MIRRKKPIARKSWLRSSRVARSRRRGIAGKRRKAEQERVYGPPEFRDWLHEQPCCVSGLRGNIHQAHVRNGGMSRKADAKWTIPLDGEYHERLHTMGQRSFEEWHGVDLIALAEQTQQRWQAHCRATPTPTRAA